MENVNLPANIVFYDGDCGLCNYGVQFILTHDKTKEIYFSPLQEELGQKTLKVLKLPIGDLSTFVYKRNNQYYTKSTAALYAIKDCKSWISILFVFIVIPTPIRDFVYSLIAKKRHLFFKNKTTCWLPTTEFKKRFI